MNVKQLFECIEDPTKMPELIEYISTNKTVLQDEFGETYELISFNGLNIPVAAVLGAGSRSIHQPSTRKLRDDDIMLITFPKTGTHWTCNLLHYLLNDGPVEETLSKEPTFLETYTDQELEAVKSPRIIATHMVADLLPPDTYKKGRKMILCFRNPKDTAVSLYYHFKNDRVVGQEMNVSWDCYFDSFIKGLFIPSDYFDFYNSWQQFIQKRTDLDFLIVHYEDLKTNGLEELRRIQKYLGLEYSDERLNQILERCSSKNLKADVEQKRVNTPFLTREGTSYVYRKGIIGDWKNHLTVAQNKQIEALAAQKFKNSIFKWKV